LLYVRNQSQNKDFSTNSHSTKWPLKHSMNFQSVENVRSWNVVEFEFDVRHIPNVGVNTAASLSLGEPFCAYVHYGTRAEYSCCCTRSTSNGFCRIVQLCV